MFSFALYANICFILHWYRSGLTLQHLHAALVIRELIFNFLCIACIECFNLSYIWATKQLLFNRYLICMFLQNRAERMKYFEPQLIKPGRYLAQTYTSETFCRRFWPAEVHFLCLCCFSLCSVSVFRRLKQLQKLLKSQMKLQPMSRQLSVTQRPHQKKMRRTALRRCRIGWYLYAC